MSNTSQHCVAIIGAGVSGLVSAVNMHKVGIRPTVFDKASGIGGMWNSDLRPCWNSMQTNISKFSTALTDFPWPTDAPLFPSQHEVYLHLSNYVRQSLPDDVFQLNTQVTNVTYSEDTTPHWTVHYRATSNHLSSSQFDFVIVASGFFDSIHMPDNIIGLSSFQGTCLHSSDYRSSDQVRDKRVILVGASISAADIAADMATTAKHVIHITSRNFWSVPRFIPSESNDPASPFLPIDLVLHRRSKQTTDNEIIFPTADDYKKIDEYFRSIAGGNQQSFSLIPNTDDTVSFKNISNMYAQWNRAGKITLKQGQLSEVQDDGTLILDNGTTIKTTCDDILMLCTGFGPSLDFFSTDILKQLSYKPDDLFCPFILHRNVFHPSLHNLAFVGMYRGLFWIISELQARWVASIFSGHQSIPSIDVQEMGLDVERRIRAQYPRPQFPHNDYVGLINGLLREMPDAIPSNIMDIVVPAQYRTDGPDILIFNEIDSICEAAKHGRFVAGVVFRALHESKWSFERSVSGQTTEEPTHGEAQFHFFQPQQLLYTEQNKLILSSIKACEDALHILQNYMYVYDEDNDVIKVYFIENDNTLGSLFHTIFFQSKQQSLETSQSGWTAIGEHQSNQDHYSISYLFVFNGLNLSRFEITYTVNGPAKDYVSKSIFRPENDE